MNTYKRFAQIAALEMDYLRIMADFQSARMDKRGSKWLQKRFNGFGEKRKYAKDDR